ncbi:MAG: cation-translocating P-type ATPase [Clostridiales bacterium]|nr:cation-translocating P-type ATPase [Clostridiales bacterium]
MYESKYESKYENKYERKYGNWHENKYEKDLKSGLSHKEAANRLSQHGPNCLTEGKKKAPFLIFVDQFTDFMVIVLLAATVVSALMGDVIEAITILAIVFINAILGFIQEYRTERTLEVLKRIAAPNAKVIRSGEAITIPASELVPGDIIMLQAGDRVPADAELIKTVNLQADESLLTGESVAVEKIDGMQVYMGTTLTRGRGTGIVKRTGMSTEMGKVAHLIENAGDEATPLQRRLEHLGKIIVYCCLAICAIVSIAGILRGEPVFQMLLAGISLAVAAVPEGLPAIVTISLALGVRRMLKRKALIRRLPAVETLGSANIICSDKTGTLTQNKMKVRKVYVDGKILDIENILNVEKVSSIEKVSGTEKISMKNMNNYLVIKADQAKTGIILQDPLTMSLLIAGNCNNSADPTETALLEVALAAGIGSEAKGLIFERVMEIPFDSDRKCMTVVCKYKNSDFVLIKGAPDIILSKCCNIMKASGINPLTSQTRKEVLFAVDTMASQAMRVIAVAWKRTESEYDIESNLTFAGLFGIQDPPRPEVLDAVRKCKSAGIRPVMITGDYKLTATTIALQLGIMKRNDIVMTGAELDDTSEEKLDKIIDDISVFARVSPGHKLRIVKTLKKKGHIVAMTGDGVNDAPAIKEADIGVSMGISGTDVTREASSMILLDDNFSTIVNAVEEGRVIYGNIRKFIRYLLSCNLGEVLTMFVAIIAGLPVPLLPIQILWVNLVTDGLPAIALGMEPPSGTEMSEPSRRAKENIFSSGLLPLIILRGSLLGFCSLATFWTILQTSGGNIPLARTGAFMTLVATQLVHVFECKSEKKCLFRIPIFNNIFLIAAVMCSVIMILMAVYLPLLQPIFKTVSLKEKELLIVLAFTVTGPLISGIVRYMRRKLRKRINF